MKKKAAKVIVYIAGTVILSAAAFMYSFANGGLPKTPEPKTGRIYPLTTGRGGLRGYMTHKERLELELSLGLCALFIIVAAFTDYYLDPFERRETAQRGINRWNG